MSSFPDPTPSPSKEHRAVDLTVLSAAGVIALFVAGQSLADAHTGHLFDYAHWTLAYTIAVFLAWSGVRNATAAERVPRRWFAVGLTLTLVAQILSDIQDLAHWIPIANLSDALFLAIGPCFVFGLLAPMRAAPPLQRRPFDLDVFALAMVILTLTLDLYLPRRGNMEPVDLAILIIYPVCMLTPACIGAVMAPTLRLRLDARWVLFLVASVLNSAIWMVWNTTYVVDNWRPAAWLKSGLLADGARARHRREAMADRD